MESPDEAEIETIRVYEEEIGQKRTEVVEEEFLAQAIGQTHLIFAIAVGFLATGISLSGMLIVVTQKWLWRVVMVFGVMGAIGVALGIIAMLQ